MSSNTEKLNLLKVDPVADGEQYFNVDTMLNANWDKVDAFADQMGDKVDGDLLPRLNNVAISDLILQPGTQTIQATRDTACNLTGISGRMLLNLLGRSGNCESLTGWTISGTGTLNTNNFVVGTSSIQITANSSGGILSRPFSFKTGATYILAASFKMSTATGAFVSITNVANGTVVTSSTNFATSYLRFTATSAAQNIAIVLQATQGQTAYVDAVRLYEISAQEYTQISSMTTDAVDRAYPYTEGLAGVKNPYAIRWTSPAKTDIASMLAFDTELLAPPVVINDTERDRLEQGTDGQYYKTTQWKKITLNGDLIWNFRTSSAGVKRVQVTGLGQAVSTLPQGYMIKFDGSLLRNDLGAIADWNTGDNWQFGDSSYSNLIISIASADSGWGDNYTPTNDEIKAYFYGWKMYDWVNGTGTSTYNAQTGQAKGWCRRVPGADTTQAGSYVEGTPVLPTLQASGWTSYELIYKRSTFLKEPVFSEGTLDLAKNDNIIELGSGLILREKANVWKAIPGSESSVINNIDRQSSWLRNKARRIVQVYKNNKVDNRWIIANDNFAYGAARAFIPNSVGILEDSEVYNVTYIQLNQYPTTNFAVTISTNEYSIINNLIRNAQQTSRRVSVIEMQKADKTPNSSTWILPTLLNGWSAISGYRTGYRKIGNSNIVQMSGVLTNGATTVGTVLLYLPQGYRPASSFVFTANSRDNSGNYNSITLDVRDFGAVLISFGTPYTGALTFQVTFEAEQ